MAVPTRSLNHLLDIALPIWQAPLPFSIISPTCSGEITAHGALGILRVGETSNCADLALQIEQYQQHTPRPAFCFMHPLPQKSIKSPDIKVLSYWQEMLHLDVHPADSFDDLIEIAISANPCVIGFANGIPDADFIRTLHEKNIITFAICHSVLEAITADDFGIDILVLQGYEAGGEQCRFSNALPEIRQSAFTLLQQVRQHSELPLVIWGDFTHGADIVAAMIAGAEGVMLDRAFVQCQESSIDTATQTRILNKNEYDSIIDKTYTTRPMRYIAPEYSFSNAMPDSVRELVADAFLRREINARPLPVSPSPCPLPTTLMPLLETLKTQISSLCA